MKLSELIEKLEKYQQDKVVSMGFTNPHSYRGNYEQLAFEPKENVSVGEMLRCSKDSLNKTFQGYKGGYFKMDENTLVNIAEYGCCGESIGPILMSYMLGDY